MKECKYCGMPLPKGYEDEVCDFCKNDDGADVLSAEAADEEIEM